MNLIFLIAGHYLGDFALQGDFVAKFKAPRSADFWFHVMVAHCAIHAGIVVLITKNPWLGLGEFATHFALDCLKCEKKISFNQDQIGHLLFKLVWFFLM